MRGCMMFFGLVRTLFGGDYRSQGQRRKLRRLGREFLRERAGEFPLFNRTSTGDEGLRAHPNAVRP